MLESADGRITSLQTGKLERRGVALSVTMSSMLPSRHFEIMIVASLALSLIACDTNPSSRGSQSDVARLQPVIEAGQFVGYRAYPGKARNRFICLGLEPGDFIQGIDGQSIKGKVVVGDMKVADGTLDAFTRRSEAFSSLITKALMSRSKVILQLQRKALMETVIIDSATKKKCREYKVPA